MKIIKILLFSILLTLMSCDNSVSAKVDRKLDELKELDNLTSEEWVVIDVSQEVHEYAKLIKNSSSARDRAISIKCDSIILETLDSIKIRRETSQITPLF
jgi:hypothetical protein